MKNRAVQLRTCSIKNFCSITLYLDEGVKRFSKQLVSKFFCTKIKYHFTCGETKLYQILESFHNFMSAVVDLQLN